MKTLITKSDGTPTKSKVYAVKYLQDKGISEDCLIQENGQFFYEEEEVFATQIPKNELPKCVDTSESIFKPVTWDTPVYDKNNEKTKLIIHGTDIVATINCKHPAGQNRQVSAFEINIGNENFIMSVDLVSRIFKVMEGATHVDTGNG